MYTRICLWGHDLDVGYIYLNPSYRPFVVLNKTYTDIYENAAGKKGHERNGQRKIVERAEEPGQKTTKEGGRKQCKDKVPAK